MDGYIFLVQLVYFCELSASEPRDSLHCEHPHAFLISASVKLSP